MLSFFIGAACCAALVYAHHFFASFSAQSPDDYAAGPVFDIRERLNGEIDCEGVIYGPFGRVVSRFTARFNAAWSGDTGTMYEMFKYDSGNVQRREWSLLLSDSGVINATAADLIGPARGRQHGSAVVLNYRIKLPDDAGGYIVDVVDWMYLMENGTIVNRSEFRKFGFKVAELVAMMRPVGVGKMTGE